MSEREIKKKILIERDSVFVKKKAFSSIDSYYNIYSIRTGERYI